MHRIYIERTNLILICVGVVAVIALLVLLFWDGGTVKNGGSSSNKNGTSQNGDVGGDSVGGGNVADDFYGDDYVIDDETIVDFGDFVLHDNKFNDYVVYYNRSKNIVILSDSTLSTPPTATYEVFENVLGGTVYSLTFTISPVNGDPYTIECDYLGYGCMEIKINDTSFVYQSLQFDDDVSSYLK